MLEISLNGEVQGRTPLEIDRLPEGVHTIKAEYEGYQPFFQEVEVKAEKKTEVVITLGELETFAQYTIELEPIEEEVIDPTENWIMSELPYIEPLNNVGGSSEGSVLITHPDNLNPVISSEADDANSSSTGAFQVDIGMGNLFIGYLFPIGFGPVQEYSLSEGNAVELFHKNGSRMVRSISSYDGVESHNYVGFFEECVNVAAPCYTDSGFYAGDIGVNLIVRLEIPVNTADVEKENIIVTADEIARRINAQVTAREGAVEAVDVFTEEDAATYEESIVEVTPVASRYVDDRFGFSFEVTDGWTVEVSQELLYPLGFAEAEDGHLVYLRKDGYEVEITAVEGNESDISDGGVIFADQTETGIENIDFDGVQAFRTNFVSGFGRLLEVGFPNEVGNDNEGFSYETMVIRNGVRIAMNYYLPENGGSGVEEVDQPYVQQMDEMMRSFLF